MPCPYDQYPTYLPNWLQVLSFDAFLKPLAMFEFIKDVIIVKCLIELSFLILYLTISYFLDKGTTKMPRDSCLYSEDELLIAHPGGSEPNYINYSAQIFELKQSNGHNSTCISSDKRSPFRSFGGLNSHTVSSPVYKSYGTESLLQRYPSVFSEDPQKLEESSES